MRKYLLIAAGWVALSYPVYRFVGPGATVAYGVLSLVGLLIWALTRKKPTA
jgi:hypothetical protein